MLDLLARVLLRARLDGEEHVAEHDDLVRRRALLAVLPERREPHRAVLPLVAVALRQVPERTDRSAASQRSRGRLGEWHEDEPGDEQELGLGAAPLAVERVTRHRKQESRPADDR